MPTSESSKPFCSLICVGSELLRGKINTHGSLIARRLASIGLDLNEEHTVPDALEAMERTLRRALQENHVVIVTGGLGPTFDDLTREAASRATGKVLHFIPALAEKIEAKFRRAGHRSMPPANKRQACLLQGAVPIANRAGTAPGQWLVLRGSRKEKGGSRADWQTSFLLPTSCLLILLPGPPSEMEPMLNEFVLPRLQRTFPSRPRAESHLHFVGVPESVIDHRVRPVVEGARNVEFTILAHLGLVDLDIFVSAPTQRQADRHLAAITRKIQVKVGRSFYGQDENYPLEKVVGDQLAAHKATLAVAESCTGGMLANRLTDIPGSSRYFLGGVISYDNSVKVSGLGVSPEVLRSRGAVSKEVAAAMARGVRKNFGSTWGVAVTGIAGPTGATRGKPVGLVFIGLAGPRSTRTIRCLFRGSRDAIRRRTVIAALNLLRQIYL